MTRNELLSEGLLAKFLRYVQVETTSAEDPQDIPSTPGQWELARILATELETMGLEDVRVDEHGIVTATLPARGAPEAPAVGFLAHMDTSPAAPGRGIQPIVHRSYRGGDLVLPAGPVLSEADHPLLREVVGHDLVTSSGDTLLGADDKAGVAALMEALCRLLKDERHVHGPIRVAFTPDEENGKGIEHFDVAGFGAVAAYTLDGGRLGELEWENFNALNLRVTLQGRSAHTGTARGAMVNAVHLAARLIEGIPAEMRPETTQGREGFLHVDRVQGSVEQVEMAWLLRDFTAEGLQAKRALLERELEALRLAHPGAEATVAETGGYRNMREALERFPQVVERAREAYRDAGVEPIETPIRGGTDGARLSQMGLPTPNLFAGGVNFHSRTEWVSVQWMEKAVEVVLALAGRWARR
ncbi:peptidase T [Limnochorda pilosa]|uniref:Peptidase T n=1 Tax=Limnochorda pilosa TaxID=1555112 RepID=A0A0K2SQ87_LIMPI|nr:peptidase T [Limnochorda pilosa]BAS29152.1 peptidase T [Limnochorda pilosa]